MALFVATSAFFVGCAAQTPPNPLAGTELVASPEERVADGNATVSVELVARDALGAPLSGVSVEFAIVPAGPAFSSPVGLTDATGSAQTSLTSTQAGNFTLTANLVVGGVPVAAPQAAPVRFVEVGAPDAPLIGPASSSTSALALFGSAQAGTPGGLGIGVSLRDSAGIAISNMPVTLVSSVPSDVITPARATTTSYGVAALQLAATQAGPRTLSATGNGLTIKKVVTILPGNANSTNSTMSVAPNTNILGNGNAVATLVTTLVDDYLNPLSQQTVALSCSPNCFVTNANVTTNATGTATSPVGASGGGSVTFTATSGSTSLTLSQSFIEPLTSTVTLAESAVVAGAGAQLVASIQAAAPSGYALGNAPFVLSSPSPDVAFTPRRGITDANGQVQSTVGYSLAGNHPLFARLGGNQLVTTSFVASAATNSCPNAAFTLPLAPSLALSANAMAYSVAVADFNGDGADDLAITDVGLAPTLWIFLNDGNDGYLTPQTYALSGNAFGLAAGQLNQPGVIDLVVPQSDGNTVTLMLNQGNGSFVVGPSLAVGLGPRGVVVADFDQDGNNDIAVAASVDAPGGNAISVWFNDGNASFTSALTLPTDRAPIALASGLLNNDTLVDLVVAHNHNNTVATVLGQPNRTFAAASLYATSGNVTGLATGDVNGDGFVDVALVTSAAPFVQTFLSNASGQLTPHGSFANGMLPLSYANRGLALADINADGALDLLVADGGLRTWLGDGNGNFQASFTYGALDTAPGLAAFAGKAGAPNARLAVAPSPAGHEVFVYAHLENHSVAAQAVQTGAYAHDFQAADITGDGLSDLIVPDANASSIKLFAASPNTSGAGYTPLAALAAHPNITNVAVADVSGDGVLDIVAINASQPGIDIFVNAGNATFAPAKNMSLGSLAQALAAADITGDGLSDLLVLPAQSNQLLLWRATGGGNVAFLQALATGANATLSLTGDVNGDGAADVVIAGAPGDANLYVHLNSNGVLMPPVITTLVAQPLSVVLADIDGDGVLDVVALAKSSVSWYRGQQSGTFALAHVFGIQTPTPLLRAALLVSDVTGDGVPDVLWAAGGILGVATNDGLGNLTLHPDSFLLGGPHATLRLGNATSMGVLTPLFVSDVVPLVLTLPFNGCPG